MPYRVRSKCLKCGNEWVSRMKDNPTPPVKCPNCGSYRVKKLYGWEVEKRKSWFNW